MTTEEAINAIKEASEYFGLLPSEFWYDGKYPIGEAIDMAIEALKDRPQGEWEHWGNPFSDESEVIDTIVCSVCRARFIEPKYEPKGEYNFCPSCGARMDNDINP